MCGEKIRPKRSGATPIVLANPGGRLKEAKDVAELAQR